MNDDHMTPFQRLDQICARMNSGLTAVAVVLGLMAACLGVIRAAETGSNLDARASSTAQLSSPTLNLSPY
ncbi:MAG TPA: hypothetical protein VL282_03265 [Tepidisphaeraceae bacterium]|jgi:hypothetical protein|nr:hypothetical protein [Tepidisphaeraceae bacterium]HXS41884.1 hypothetical protein [Stellaceae bacterium]